MALRTLAQQPEGEAANQPNFPCQMCVGSPHELYSSTRFFQQAVFFCSTPSRRKNNGARFWGGPPSWDTSWGVFLRLSRRSIAAEHWSSKTCHNSQSPYYQNRIRNQCQMPPMFQEIMFFTKNGENRMNMKSGFQDEPLFGHSLGDTNAIRMGGFTNKNQRCH